MSEASSSASSPRWDSVAETIATSSGQQRKYFRKFSNAKAKAVQSAAPQSVSLLEHIANSTSEELSTARSHAEAPNRPMREVDAVQTKNVSPEASSIHSTELSSDAPSSLFSVDVATSSSESLISADDRLGKATMPIPETDQSESPAQIATDPTSVDDVEYTCRACASNFRTQGLLSAHHNRVHNPRFSCSLCHAKFGLRLDLVRHKHTKHKSLFGTTVTFYCTNVGCATPEKKFHRKDNYQRHVRRCRQAGGTRCPAVVMT